MSNKTTLITHTGSHKKVIVNIELAEELLDIDLYKRLNSVLIELNDVQESRLKQGGIVNDGRTL